MSEHEADSRHAKPRVLLVDDSVEFCEDLAAVLSDEFEVILEYTAQAGLAALRRERPDLCILDIDLGGETNGLDLLLQIRQEESPPPAIMLTGDERIRTAVRAIRLGAHHYLTKPPNLDELTAVLRRAHGDDVLRRRMRSLERDVDELKGEIIAGDPKFLQVLELIAKVAPTEATVLITGESGTGKELFARRIHSLSNRSEGPFVAVNCAALPDELIESELFGHVKGAFTGADRDRQGKFEQARGGTLFLDEMGDSPPSLQVKLLRVLEERAFTRVGGSTAQRADLRILAATSKDVEKQVARGELREELYYRLNVFRVEIPPLRDRPGDILPIALHYMNRFARRIGKRIDGIAPAAVEVIGSRPWPGNVRELRNAVERAVILCEGDKLDLPDLAAQSRYPATTLKYEAAKLAAVERFQREYLSLRLREAAGNVTRAAEAGGIRRQSFQAMLRNLEIEASSFRSGDKE